MQTKISNEVRPQKGINTNVPAPVDTANQMENFTYDQKTQAWHNYLGYEPFFSSKAAESNTNFGFPGISGAVQSCYVYQRHRGAQQWYLYEAKNASTSVYELYFIDGSREQGVEINSDFKRTRTPKGSPHTSYEPFGQYCIIVNGLDIPLKYRGGSRLYELGWTRRPGSPQVLDPDDPPPDTAPITWLESLAKFKMAASQIGQQSDSEFPGLGNDDGGTYKYKITFINEAGSESPISDESNTAAWDETSITKDSTTYKNYPFLLINLPIGPNGTVARRIYRTKNGTEDYFFCKQVNDNASEWCSDYFSDAQLGAAAPLDSDSVVMPAQGARLAAGFKNCLFIDGGDANPSRLFFSTPLQPDTFKADNFFDISSREGGDITALEPYYNSLLVFRENAIDLVRGNPVNGFELVPFIQGVGTNSPHTVVPIPNVGISFLSEDGCYIIQGGLDGGSNLKLAKISLPIQETFERLSEDLLPSAVGAFSQKWRELHYYVGIDGGGGTDGGDLNLGLVYRIDNGQWTFRTGDYPVACISTDRDGNFIFGPSRDQDKTNGIADTGLQVISSCHNMGTLATATGGEPAHTYSPAPMVACKWRSAWHDFGDPTTKKYVKYVYLYIMTEGNNPIDFSYYRDRDWTTGETAFSFQMQRGDHPDQPVYTATSADPSAAVWGTSRWQHTLLTQVRIPISQKACSDFAFEFETSNPIHFMGYRIELNADKIKTIKGKS